MSLSMKNINLTVNEEIYLKDISLDFESGSTNIFLGRTLAGKTSLLRIMAGLDRPDSGRIFVNGKDVTGVSVRKRNISMVYQQFINYPSFTIYENIASPLKILGMDKTKIDRRVRQVAEMLHLESMLDRIPTELSGGQQQRCAIARALVKDSTLLLLDEPLVNLDYKLREELQIDLQDIFKQRDAIVVYTTTEPAEALKLGGNIAVLDKGRMIQTGVTSQVYHKPASIKVAEVFSDPPINLLSCSVDGASIKFGQNLTIPLKGHLSQLASGNYIAGIRSNHLYLNCQNQNDIKLETIVELAEINGSETFIHVDYGTTKLVVQEVGVYSRKIDSTIMIYLDPSNLFIFSESGSLILSPDNRSPEKLL
ncbi:MAG: ABC transporter ATP-binding protein [Proteobacteria bacterium]|nr:ABC transporter ATP-binding protein [Pseudomonadota bacterium]MBU1584414.1 ABC transporter ATP-binding protein [Pseudomonadota bacterium]MBU2451696.1 ABC transporter ATP-binding protein [Pseudomonadota bacterium]MBU2628542.1 ABC transporter ATP-binding protein [Pseudomonadota bacterium]